MSQVPSLRQGACPIVRQSLLRRELRPYTSQQAKANVTTKK
jgi:hypothetical protein